MRYIRTFNESVNYFLIENKLKDFGIENYIIHDDGTVDVEGGVSFTEQRLQKIPFKFGEVSYYFILIGHDITSLEGSPYYVGGNFICYDNKIKSMIGSPEEIGGDFDISFNNLESLEGMPLEIGGHFDCSDNNLKELDSISNINGYIICDKDVDISKFRGYCKGFKYYNSIRELVDFPENKLNESLVNKLEVENSLKYYGIENYTINDDGTIDVNGDVNLHNKNLKEIPFKFGKVIGNFYVGANKLTSLKGCPYYVDGEFSCSTNNLKSLDYCPSEVTKNFYAHVNEIDSTEDFNVEIGGNLYLTQNSFDKLEGYASVGGFIYCNDYVNTRNFGGYCERIIKAKYS